MNDYSNYSRNLSEVGNQRYKKLLSNFSRTILNQLKILHPKISMKYQLEV